MTFPTAKGVVKRNDSGNYKCRESCLRQNVSNKIMFQKGPSLHTLKNKYSDKNKLSLGLLGLLGSLESIEGNLEAENRRPVRF